MTLLRHYIIIAWRNLIRNKLLSSINVFGISSALACFILIFAFVLSEYNYDNFHLDRDRIYQVIRKDYNPDGSYELAGTTPMPLNGTLKSEYHDICTTIGLYRVINKEVKIKSEQKESNGYLGLSTEQEFFEVFNFPFLYGDPQNCLKEPNDVVVTERAAKKMYGDQLAIGKTISINEWQFVIRGIIKNLPSNSVFKADLYFSSTLREKMDPDLNRAWWSSGAFNFVKLKPHISSPDLVKIFEQIENNHFPDFLRGVIGFDIQSIKDIHLNTEVKDQIYPTISKVYLRILIIVTLAIMLIATINYINIIISKTEQRAKETGVKKVSGATKNQLLWQYLIESIIICLIAAIPAIIFAEMSLPWFNTVTSRDISFDNYRILLITIILVFSIIIGLLASLYPSLVLSSFKPIKILKNNTQFGTGNKTFRRILVIFQLSVTTLLISSVLMVKKQIHFMQTADLGYDLNNIVSIPLLAIKSSLNDRLKASQNYLNAIQPYFETYQIQNATVCENIPGFYTQNHFRIHTPNTEREFEVISMAIDEHFFEVFNIDILQGNGFQYMSNYPYPEKIIITESTQRKFGTENIIGETFELFDGHLVEVIGIIRDLHVESLQNPLKPLIFRYGRRNNYPSYISFRYKSDRTKATIDFLGQHWKKLFPDIPFSYFFPKEKYEDHYQEEKRIAKILSAFMLLTITISALGLFSMILYVTQRKTKEIGIRKTYGASVNAIITLLSKEVLISVILSFLIAFLPSWYSLNKWLENFAYKTQMSIWILLLAGGLTLVIAIFTVGWHTFKAARRNPIETLRYE